LQNLEQRLVSRFEWGLVAEMQPPDVETRMRSCAKRKRLSARIFQMKWSIFSRNASAPCPAPRGALNRVFAFQSLTGKKLTIQVVEGLLREVLHEEGRFAVNIESIQRRVAEHFDIRLADMTSKRRPENIAFPRQIAMFLSAR